MKNNVNLNDSVDLAKKIAEVLIEKKGIDVKAFCVEGHTSVTDYYVNATGRSGSQVLALCDDVCEKIEEYGRSALRVEGRSGNSWLLVDYGDVIVNIFDKGSREFYNFDRLMPEGSGLDLSEIIAEIDKKYDINTAKE